MNRRAFLSLFASAAATAVLDPERLLWVPGQKTIFIPEKGLLPVELNLNEINRLTLEYIIPAIADSVFKSTPLFTYSFQSKDSDRAIRRIELPLSYRPSYVR